jgi:hypothetical protein
MGNENRSTDPPADSGYASNHSTASSSQDRKGKGKEPVTSSQPETISGISTAGFSNTLESPAAFLSPFIRTNPTANNFESTVYEQQSFENINFPRQPQLEGPVLDTGSSLAN